MMEKMKLKMTTVLIATLFVIIAIVTPVATAHSTCPKRMYPKRMYHKCMYPKRTLVMAKGDDIDIAGATTSIIAMIEYDKASGIPSVAQVEFQTKIYDELGEKIYSMKGKLKDALVISDSFQFYCSVREVMWINLWFIMGEGKLKTTDADIEIEYRGETVTLPNTEGQYIPYSFWMMVNPTGEYVLDVSSEDPEIFIWPQGGWATVIITIGGIPSIGAVTYLTKYMEI